MYILKRSMTYTLATKTATYKWRDGHREQFLELERNYQRKRYSINKDEKKQKTLAHYYYKKDLKSFLNILIDEI